MARGKTIQIYLPDGNPKGIKICEIPNSIIKAILIPRNMINEALKYENLDKVGIYFLFSEKNEFSEFKTYIGEAEEIKKRFKQHDTAQKDYWNYMVCFVSGKDNLNKAHVKFLESFCYEEATKCKRTELMNGCSPTRSNLSPSDKDFTLNFYDEIKLILGTLGYPIFDKIKEEEKDLFYCKVGDISAKGSLTEDGFVIFGGSLVKGEVSPSYPDSFNKMRRRLIDESSIIDARDNDYIFTRNTTFNSPSSASTIILGRNSNGWKVWKNKEGKTLDEIKRQ